MTQLLKKRVHPLGGFHIARALKWLVPANPAMLTVGVIMLVVDVFQRWDRWVREGKEAPIDYYVRLGFWLAYVAHMVVGYPLDFLLHVAFKNEDVLKLKIWSVANFFNTFWATLIYWAHTFYFGFHYATLAPYNFYCAYRFYMCRVIYYHSFELEEEEEAKAAARLLTETELQEFEEGLTEQEKALEVATKSLIEKVMYMRYKKEDFEIDIKDLEIDEDQPLGRGMYGVVYKAVYNRKGKGPLQVAIKTFESGIMDAVCFKALLAELKVMTYLGNHENVLSLVGAVTAEIKMRKLKMILEFCPFGCLLEHIRSSRGLYVNYVVDGQIDRKKASAFLAMKEKDELSLSTLDLIRWTFEIARGMEFLESMKVVHGDLAARNLLLTEYRQIKIADFGLARQLYQYSVYVKRQNAPLPWRWLALESITDMNFSSKSDVWSFGVVIHELFTLGEVPYEDFKQFNFDFIDSIRNGMRLERSSLCPINIYNCMRQCWDEDVSQRPSFHELNKALQSLANAKEDKVQESSTLATATAKPNEYIFNLD